MINTVERLRADIDSGRTADKIAASDPASAPLGADDEAAARVFGAAGHFRPRLSLNPMKRSGASVEDYQFAGLDVSCMETCWRAADSCRNLLRCRSMVAC